MKLARRVLLFATLLIISSGCTIATVRTLEEDVAAKEGFNPDFYVATIWDTEFLPTITEESVEIVMLLEALETNEEAATEQYGNRTSTGPYSFMAQGEARILELDRSSRVGLAPMDLPPYDGEADVFFAIGPVLRGNALRDAVGFIVFNDFTNQVEFASVSTALKDRITADLLEQVDLEALVGETVRFVGAFTYEDPDEVVIMPVILEGVE
ncbi:MAG: DUF2291 domain-containing protein [Chloroflexota bacterium]